MFEETLPPDATTQVRRSLSNLDMSKPSVLKLLATVRTFMRSFESPTWRGNATAHVGFVRERVAIFVCNHATQATHAYLSKKRDEWKKSGWRLLHVNASAIENASVEEIADSLRKAMK